MLRNLIQRVIRYVVQERLARAVADSDYKYSVSPS